MFKTIAYKLANLIGGNIKMAKTKQYVVYTREFIKGNVKNKIGVFLDEAKNTLDTNGDVNGGVIKYKNLKNYNDPLTSFINILITCSQFIFGKKVNHIRATL